MQDRIGALIAIRPIRSSPKAMLSPFGGYSIRSVWTRLSMFFSSMPYPILTSAQFASLSAVWLPGREQGLESAEGDVASP